MRELLHYLPGEICEPPSGTMSDLDWTLVSWDLVRRDTQSVFAQILIGPGVLMTRYGAEDDKTWIRRSPTFESAQTLTMRWSTEDLVTDRANEKTQEYLEARYHLEAGPYAFTVDPGEYPDWPRETAVLGRPGTPAHPVESIGQVLIANQMQSPMSKTFYAAQDVFNASYVARREHLRRS